MGIGVHQDGGRRMTRVALHRLEVTVRLQELVGGTGVPQTVEHDLLKLQVFCPPHTVTLCQNVRGNGQAVRGEKCAVRVKQLVGAQKIVTEQGFVEKAFMDFLPPSGGVFQLSLAGVIAGYPMQTVFRFSRCNRQNENKKAATKQTSPAFAFSGRLC